MNSEANQFESPIFLSEIFPLKIDYPNLMRFRLTPEVGRELGNRMSWRFSQKFIDIIVIWQAGYFWVLAKPEQPMPERDEWREKLAEICEKFRNEIGDRAHSIQWVREPDANSEILAQLAVRVLKVRKPFFPQTVWSQDRVEVRRQAKYWAETFEWQEKFHPALVLKPQSYFAFTGTLENFYNNHPYRHNPEKLLVGLKVRDIEKNSLATIVTLAGTMAEQREELQKKATGAMSKQALIDAPDEQPIVAVRFGKNPKEFHYAVAALYPCVTEATADRFEVNYGDLLKQTKVSYEMRKECLIDYKKIAEEHLKVYGFQIKVRSLNSRQYPSLFSIPPFDLKETELLFANNYKSKRSAVLKGLSQRSGGGVYRRHAEFRDRAREVRITALKLCDFKVDPFLEEIQKRLREYGFRSIVVNRVAMPVSSSKADEDRAEVEKKVNELMLIPTDIILTFLPQSDRNADKSEEGSFYTFISSRLVRRGIASQVIYEQTIKQVNNYRNILNQVVPGILAKLGNLPFILAKPLAIADYFIGFDVSRIPTRRGPGSLNVCASVRLYGKRGEFIRYRLEDALTEGEEIGKKILEKFLPRADLEEKTVLIYRDGRFCGDEIKHLREREKAINSEFILVECIKSGLPRLFQSTQKKLTAPPKGLALYLSSQEVILITTAVKSEKMGLPNPLRLRVVSDRAPKVSLESLIEATLKLTLLHHGALKEPRLPIPLFGSDRIARRRLQGISPGLSDGDRQFWL